MNYPLRVYLPASAMTDDTTLVDEFFEFMACMNHRHWDLHQKPIEPGPEVDVHSALRYIGEVNNGGHNQYINNMDNDQGGFRSALSGLSRLGADEYAAVLSDMIDWTQANPSAVEKMLNTFDYVEQPTLLDLNDRFFGIESVLVSRHAADWIKAHPRLTVVSEEEFMAIRNGKIPEES